MGQVVSVKLSEDQNIYGVPRKKGEIVKFTQAAFREVSPKGTKVKPAKASEEK